MCVPGSTLVSFDIDFRIGDFGAVSTETYAEPLPRDEPGLGKPLVGDRKESASPVERSLTDDAAMGEAGLSLTISSCKLFI